MNAKTNTALLNVSYDVNNEDKHIWIKQHHSNFDHKKT